MCIGAAGATSLKAIQRSSSYTICAGISFRIIFENMVSAELSAGGATPVFVDMRQTSTPNPKHLLLAINGVEAKDMRLTLTAARSGTTEYLTCCIKLKVEDLIGMPKPLTQPTNVRLARYFAIPPVTSRDESQTVKINCNFKIIRNESLVWQDSLE